jgi:hypothetical protein
MIRQKMEMRLGPDRCQAPHSDGHHGSITRIQKRIIAGLD